MGEWKRVLLNPRRLAATALIVVLSVAFFFVGRMEYFGRGAITRMVEGERYYDRLVSRTRGHSPEEIDELLTAEADYLENYITLLLWDNDEYLSMPRAEVEQWAAESEFVTSLAGLEESLREDILFTAQYRVEELREELQYIKGYEGYIDSIQKQAALQSQTALFGDKNSFANRNLLRTAAEFETMRGVKVEFGSNRAVEGWAEFELADYLYLLLIILFVFAFLEERKAGLWGVIRGTSGGRWRLGLTRVAILLCVSAGGAALLYGVNLLASLALSGGWGDLGRSVQSLAVFRTLTQHITIGEWIAQYLLVKAASGFMVGLLLWCLLGSLSSAQFSLSVLCVMLAGEYALFAFLPVQSIFNPVKYFNLFSYIRTSKLYTEYLNIDLFGYPVGIRRLALGALPVSTVGFLLWAVLTAHLRRPEGRRSFLQVLADGWNKCLDVFRRRLTVGGWEVYKTFIFQKGLPVLLIILLASGTLNYIRFSNEPETGDPWVMAYLEELRGPADDYVDDYLVAARAMTEGDATLLSALDEVEEQVETLRERARAGGYEPWIVGPVTPYDCVYGPKSLDLQRLNAAFAIVFIILCCAPVCAFERQSGVVPMLRSLKRGRCGVFVRKLLTTLLMTAMIWVAVYGREFREFVRIFHPGDIAAPVGNFSELSAFPFPGMTVGQFLALLYALRYLMLAMLAMAVMFISGLCPTVELAYMINLALLGLPAILYALGIDFLRFLTPVNAISAAEGLWALAGTGRFSGLLPCAVFLVAGLAALTMNVWRSTKPTH